MTASAFFPFPLSTLRVATSASQPEKTPPDFVSPTLRLSLTLRGKQKVALWFEDSLYFIQALLASWKAGAEVMLLGDLSAHNRQWAEQADCCLTDQPDLGLNTPVYLFQGDVQTDSPMPAGFAEQALNPDAVLWLRTSGSTGEPKLIRKTLSQFQKEAEMLRDYWRIDEKSLFLGCVSHQHLYGLTFRIMLPLFAKAVISREQWVYPEPLIEQTRLAAQPVIWICSPTLLTHFGENRRWAQFAPHIQRIISSGGALPAECSQLFIDKQLPIDEIYGSTETGVIATRRGQTPWQALPSVHFEHHADGLFFTADWLSEPHRLSDLLEFHSARCFSLKGRADRIIKLADKRISLPQVEQQLQQHLFIQEAHCLVHPTQPRLIALSALSPQGIAFLREEGRAALCKRLEGDISSHLARFALPRFWRFVSRLPRNMQGKLLHQELQALALHKPQMPLWRQTDRPEQQGMDFCATIPLDLRHFSGHFANFPLVPGVVQLEWAVQQAASLGITGQIKQVENLKYQQFMRPNDKVCLSLKWEQEKNKLHFCFRVDDDSEKPQIYASGRIAYQV